MKKLALYLLFCALTPLYAVSFDSHSNDGSIKNFQVSSSAFEKISDVAQYKEADWSQVVFAAHGVTLEQAFDIAQQNPKISYFFYTKGGQMVLEREDGGYRLFRHGDAVFFSGTPWWGSAPGLADGYIKKECNAD